MSAALPLALAVLAPVMIGPLPTPEAGTIVAQLCNGGTITIPLGEDAPRQEEGCHPKGCHAGTCRPKDETKRPGRPI